LTHDSLNEPLNPYVSETLKNLLKLKRLNSAAFRRFMALLKQRLTKQASPQQPSSDNKVKRNAASSFFSELCRGRTSSGEDVGEVAERVCPWLLRTASSEERTLELHDDGFMKNELLPFHEQQRVPPGWHLSTVLKGVPQAKRQAPFLASPNRDWRLPPAQLLLEEYSSGVFPPPFARQRSSFGAPWHNRLGTSNFPTLFSPSSPFSFKIPSCTSSHCKRS
jgi:hypothetical protein